MSINISLLLHDIRSTQNVGSIMRSADCFGVKHIYFSGYTPYPLIQNDTRLPHLAKKINSRIAKTALGAETSIPFSVYNYEPDAVSAANKAGFKQFVCLEQDPTSIPINKYNTNLDLLLAVGNELNGVSFWTRQNAHAILEIAQFGKKESLNVSNATSIALYALTNMHL